MPHLVTIATDPKNASIKDVVVSGHFNTNSLAGGGVCDTKRQNTVKMS